MSIRKRDVQFHPLLLANALHPDQLRR
jgi:hypothetical protein